MPEAHGGVFYFKRCANALSLATPVVDPLFFVVDCKRAWFACNWLATSFDRLLAHNYTRPILDPIWSPWSSKCSLFVSDSASAVLLLIANAAVILLFVISVHSTFWKFQSCFIAEVDVLYIGMPAYRNPCIQESLYIGIEAPVCRHPYVQEPLCVGIPAYRNPYIQESLYIGIPVAAKLHWSIATWLGRTRDP